MKRKYLIVLAILTAGLLSASLAYNSIFNAKHRDIAQEEITISISSLELRANFVQNEKLATSNYLDKVIATTGTISSIDGDAIVLSKAVLVNLQVEEQDFKLGAYVTIKGRCIGFDELLEVVKIDQATLIKK